jgi:hypothetical protein
VRERSSVGRRGAGISPLKDAGAARYRCPATITERRGPRGREHTRITKTSMPPLVASPGIWFAAEGTASLTAPRSSFKRPVMGLTGHSV